MFLTVPFICALLKLFSQRTLSKMQRTAGFSGAAFSPFAWIVFEKSDIYIFLREKRDSALLVVYPLLAITGSSL